MRYISVHVAAILTIFFLGGLSAHAGGGSAKEARDVPFSFEGMFGKFDRAQLQRGFQVYKDVCAACHSLKYVSFRELGEADGPGFSKDEVKAIAASYQIQDGPDANGEMFDRNALPSDKFVPPYPNKEAAIAVMGAYPPDLSLITKARSGWGGTWRQLADGTGGPEYIYSLLTGYKEPSSELVEEEGGVPEGKYYNPYFKNGHWITMAPPLSEGIIEYAEGQPAATIDQMALDVSAFLAWAAEPRMVERKRMGLKVLIYISLLSILLFFSYKRVWARLDREV